MKTNSPFTGSLEHGQAVEADGRLLGKTSVGGGAAPTAVHDENSDYLVAFSGHEPDPVLETTIWVMLVSLIALSIVAGYLFWAKITFSWPFPH